MLQHHDNIESYLNFYSLNTNQIQHHYEFLQIKEEEIFLQTFTPTNPIGTVFVVHGYFDHSGSMSNLINFLTERQYQVITYDLQGHGLSTGPRATIEDFSDYMKVFKQVIEAKRPQAIEPIHVISHSTGGAIVMEYLLGNKSPFQEVILVCPLVRSYAWNLSKMGHTMISPFTNELQRMFKSNSSNTEYLEFTKQDPLQHDKVPLAWLEALVAWNEQLEKLQSSKAKIHVIQGNKDKTVDWKYNLDFIQKKFPECQAILVDGAGHQLLNETQPLLECTWAILDQLLKSPFQR